MDSSLHSLAAFFCINSLFIATVGQHQRSDHLYTRSTGQTAPKPTVRSVDAAWTPASKLEADIYFYMQPTAEEMDLRFW